MTSITVRFTLAELRLLTTLAADQLFRREFIDPRLPGYQANSVELARGKKLVERLRLTAKKADRMPRPERNGTAS
jgi:hypothetical protein